MIYFIINIFPFDREYLITSGKELPLSSCLYKILKSFISKIVSSLVNDIIMPLVGIIIGGINFTSLSIKFNDATINYGNFIQTVIDFLIVAWCIFVVIKLINSFQRKKKEEVKKEEPPKKDEQILLLEEIRDLLKNK